jgi:hypothetical protein
VLKFILLENRVVDIQDRSARVTEDVLDALFRQAAHQYFGACDG